MKCFSKVIIILALILVMSIGVGYAYTDSLIEYKATNPKTVNAGEVFYIDYSITNNSDTPIIALRIDLEHIDMVNYIYPENGWTFTPAGLFKKANLYRDNLFIEKGETVKSKVGLNIQVPGTYQIQITPNAKIGDWYSELSYIHSFIVINKPEVKTIEKKSAKAGISFEIKDTNKPKIPTGLEDADNNELWIKYPDDHKVLLVTCIANEDIKKVIAGICNPQISLDGLKVYFESSAYATSDNVFVVNIKTKKVKLVSDGNDMRVVTKGKYKGKIIISKHEQGKNGMIDPYYIVDDTGHKYSLLTDKDYKYYYNK